MFTPIAEIDYDSLKTLQQEFGLLVQVVSKAYESKLLSMKDTKRIVESIEFVDDFFKKHLPTKEISK